MRHQIWKSVAASLACSMVLGLFSGCHEQENRGEQNGRENTLIYASSDYSAINPAIYEHGEINLLLFSGLTAHDGENKVVPGLAERWEYDEKTLTYTFTLREGATWHDGEPVTSADVKFTLKAIQDPENGSEIASNYEEIDEVLTPDERTVQLKLRAPNVALLDYLTVGILPSHLLEGKDLLTDAFNHHPVGTGPYKLESWDEGQSITLVKNEAYFGGTVNIDRIVFKIVDDTKARAVQLKTGEVDLAQITPADLGQFEKDEAFDCYVLPTADYRGILYNFAHPLFAENRELPAALSFAIDRQAIVDAVLQGYGEPAYSPLQRSEYNVPDLERYDYDPQRAAALLKSAGWVKNGEGILEKNGTPLTFTIHCSEGDQVRVDMANICAQQLGELGAKVTVTVDVQTDWAGQEAYLIGWGSPFDPDDHTYKVFGSGKGSNFSAYSNAAVDEHLLLARETGDTAERRQHYQAFLQELSSDPSYTFLAYVDAVYVASARLSGFEEQPVLGHHGVGVFWDVRNWSLSA